MPGRSRREVEALQARALSLLDLDRTAEEVAEVVGVSARTVRRWRRGRETAERERRKAPGEALAEMVRAEGPAVARVILDLAKEGDIRAAALVVRLLGNTLTTAEDRDDSYPEADAEELERELGSLPPAIASEIVGLLAEAESEAAATRGGRGAGEGRGEREPVRLPWQTEGRASDEGDSTV